MTGSAETPIYEPDDIVYGNDPFKGEEAARPWLVLSNHEERPFHGEQYIALTVTTKSWLDGLLEIPDDAWIYGGTPKDSRIAPWGVQSLSHTDIDYWQGRLEPDLVEQAVAGLLSCLPQA